MNRNCSSGLGFTLRRSKLALRFKPILIGSSITATAFFPERVREYGDIFV